MSLRRWSSSFVAITAVLAIACYALADRFPLLALAGIPLALLGWFAADVRGIALAPRPFSDLLVLGAIGWSAYRVRSLGWAEGLTVSVFCEFLVAIILIKLWDKKQARDYAQIITLSVFLSVGSMLTGASLWLALLLVVNVCTLLVSVTLFHLAAGLERAGIRPDGTDKARVGIGPRAPRQYTAILVFALSLGLALSFFVFFIMPRGIGLGQFSRFGQPTGGRQTGLTDQVDLRQSGLISESARTVLEAQFVDAGGNSIGAEGRIFYLRAAVLENYGGQAWTGTRGEGLIADVPRPNERITLRGTPGPAMIVQHIIMLDAPRRSPLPHLYRPVEVWAGKPTAYYGSRVTSTLIKDSEPGRLEYTVNSSPPPAPLTQRLERNPGRIATFPIEGVKRVAAQILADSGLSHDPQVRPPGLDIEVCREFERYLRSRYTYTLDPPRPSRTRDPIEWFLTEAKSGHCEYFASAMAGLCRSVGINARVIAGYAAGEFDQATQTYTVRESNAHAWVEAEADPGIWTTFDPTPPDTLRARLKTPSGLAARWGQWLDSLNQAWSTSFISFDETSRRRVLNLNVDAEPWLREKIESIKSAFSEGGWHATAPILLGAAWRILLAIGIARGIIVLSRAISRRLAASASRNGRRPDPELARAMGHTEFFKRALTLLRKRGFPKPEWQPPLSHAADVSRRDPRLGGAARLASELYYRARFGRHALTEEELGAVHRALDDASRL